MECGLHKAHAPMPLYTQRHHILPKAWGGADSELNVIELCGTGHDNVHFVLNEMVRVGGPQNVSENLIRHFGLAWGLALKAWNMHTGPTPYT